jgi:hypothetical protein
MSHTLMTLDAEWRRLARTSRARRALKQSMSKTWGSMAITSSVVLRRS